MSLKGCLNYLKLLTNHIVKILLVLFLFSKVNFAQIDSAKVVSAFTSDTTYVISKSPWGAVLRSAVIPGWGQIYNQSYIKAPIIWGLGGWLVYLWIQNNKSYRDAISANNITYKNFYQDQRDLMAIYMGLVYVLNMVDAYVDAELFDFSFKENSFTKSPMLDLRIKF